MLIGAFLKMMHLPGGEPFIITSLVLTAVWIVSGLSEIYSSNQITYNEKVLWTLGFILLSSITGFLYFFIGRPRVLRN